MSRVQIPSLAPFSFLRQTAAAPGQLLKRRKRRNRFASRFAIHSDRQRRFYRNRSIQFVVRPPQFVGASRSRNVVTHDTAEAVGFHRRQLAKQFLDKRPDNRRKRVAIMEADGCEPTLTAIAREPVEANCNGVTIDWTERETFRAKIRVAVRRFLRKHGCPPDKQERATQTVLQQAKLLCADWAD